MMLYLVQHGRAKPKEEDPERGLTDEGAAEIRVVASAAALAGIEVSRILESGKKRATETARIIASEIGSPVKEAPDLSPMDDPGRAAKAIESATGPIMLVGHLPHLERLAALLLTGDPEMRPIKFTNGAITALEKDETGWSVRWILTPGIA